MSEDYVQILMEVMRGTKPKIKQVNPTLTYGMMGWEFDGRWYANKEAAEKARDEYYSEPNDLEGVL